MLYGPDARAHATAARELGFDPKTQVRDPLFGKVGNAGAALAPLLLAAAMEEAKAGQRLLLVGYGDGADALVLSTTPQVERLEGRRGVSWHLARRAELGSYDLYLRFRQLVATEHDRRAGAGLSATKHFRDRDADVSLLAQRCRRCGQTQFPRQRVCFACYAKDDFEPIRLSDRVGTVKSFTFDNFAGSPQPPLVAGIVDVEGARLYVQMTDVAPKEVKLGMPVELTFRKIHEAGGTPNYFWKSSRSAKVLLRARPLQGGGPRAQCMHFEPPEAATGTLSTGYVVGRRLTCGERRRGSGSRWCSGRSRACSTPGVTPPCGSRSTRGSTAPPRRIPASRRPRRLRRRRARRWCSPTTASSASRRRARATRPSPSGRTRRCGSG